jgi:hypothetical protein
VVHSDEVGRSAVYSSVGKSIDVRYPPTLIILQVVLVLHLFIYGTSIKLILTYK